MVSLRPLPAIPAGHAFLSSDGQPFLIPGPNAATTPLSGSVEFNSKSHKSPLSSKPAAFTLRAAKPSKDSSPRATGPAGVRVDRIEFQESSQRHPLDDVIVRGVICFHEKRCREIQAKRRRATRKGACYGQRESQADLRRRRRADNRKKMIDSGPDAPEVADEQMAEARPFAEAFPDRGSILFSS